MAFVPFAMERWQSTYEHEVDLNLSESGVHPLTLDELVDLAGVDRQTLASTELEYIQSNGGLELREHVAAIHPGATADNVVIANGSAESNFVATWRFCEPGDEIVFMSPSYFQIRGLAENFGVRVVSWPLENDSWRPDAGALDELVTDATRMIVVTSPNNPTGAVFDREFIAKVVAAAERVGAWVLSDEVYRGAELGDEESPTFWGAYDRVVVTGGLSKAYGLPGLRIGWSVSDPELAEELWARKDYTSIAPGAINELLARHAMHPEVRPRLLERTRSILRHNWPILAEWLGARSDIFEWRDPEAGAIAYVRFDLPADSDELSERMRRDVSCLLVPGAHFDMQDYLRIGFGPPEDRLREGLRRLDTVIDAVRKPQAAGQER